MYKYISEIKLMLHGHQDHLWPLPSPPLSLPSFFPLNFYYPLLTPPSALCSACWWACMGEGWKRFPFIPDFHMKWACGMVIKAIPVPYSCLKHLNFSIFGQHSDYISWQTSHDTITSVPKFSSLSSLSIEWSHLWTLTLFQYTITCILSYINWHLLLFGFALYWVFINC